jgi:hypothetical protein
MRRYAPPPAFCCFAAVLAACAPAREAMEGHKDAVARVEGYTLSVEHAAEILAVADENLAPPRPEVVDPLTDLWIGYTILASEYARPDTFAGVDMTPLTQFGMDQEIVWGLRQDVILAKVEPTDEELRELYEQEQPYTLVETHQILIQVPETAAEAEVDSLRQLAESLRERAIAGEDFADLARTYSQDPASATQGGYLGWVGRGRLVPELDAVILELPPGSISEPVRSTLGYHIVKVTGREKPDFEEIEQEYRLDVMERYIGGSERAYIDSLFNAAKVRLAPGAVTLVRQMVYAPRLERITPAERETVLARYRGGKLTFGEWADFVIRRSPNSRRAFSSDSATVVDLLRELVRNELLAKAARDMGYTVPEIKADSILQLAKRDLNAAAAVSGLRRSQLVSGEVTIEEAVDTVLVQLFRRERSPAPLERVSPALRRGRPTQVYPDRFPDVIERLVEIRAQRSGAASQTP